MNIFLNDDTINYIKEYEYRLNYEKLKFTSIIIAIENELNYLKACIESIEKFTDKDFYEIIVVTNESSDEVISYLNLKENISIVYNKEKKSQVASFNQGMELAKGENIVLLNSDTILTPNWLNSLQKTLYTHEEIGIVAPSSNIEDTLNLNNTYSNIDEFFNISKTINISNINLYDIKTSVSGHCMIIKKEVIDNVGYLDEHFDLGYFKEQDYCFRAIEKGYKVLLSKDTFIYYFSQISNITIDNAYGISLYRFEQKWGINLYYSGLVRYDVINHIKNDLSDNINILEVGCSLGGTLLYLKNKYNNSKVYGVELNENVCKVIKNVLPVISNNIENTEFPYEEGYFDYIIFADVLEHLNDPWNALRKVKKYLKEDGYIVASIPNIMHVQVVNDLLKGNFTYMNAGILDRTHVRFFTKNEICKLFNICGYSIEIISSIKMKITEEEELVIEKLCELYGVDKKDEYETYQYIVKVKLN